MAILSILNMHAVYSAQYNEYILLIKGCLSFIDETAGVHKARKIGKH